MLLIVGQCSIDNYIFETARFLQQFKIDYFKVSFDKANRTKLKSYRGIGLNKSLNIFEQIKEQNNYEITTDIHNLGEIKQLYTYIDLIQIPAFLCRQTDLLLEASNYKLPINIKKMQCLSAEDMRFVVEKVKPNKTYITERGTFFGLNQLVNDLKNIPIINTFSECIYDITHSKQKPYHIEMTKAAIAAGAKGLFCEIHPYPERALSDGELALNFNEFENLYKSIF